MTTPEDRIRQQRLRLLRGLQTPRVYDPGPLPPDLLQKQEIMANGVYCGNIIQSLAEAPHGDGKVRYPLDYFDEDEDPILTPDTEANHKQDADNLPILAWAISRGGGEVWVVVDILERHKFKLSPELITAQDVTPPLANCKVISGRPSDVLPQEILEKMGLI
jgi:hypothetical protein